MNQRKAWHRSWRSGSRISESITGSRSGSRRSATFCRIKLLATHPGDTASVSGAWHLSAAMGVKRRSLAWRASMADFAAAADRFDFDSLQRAVAQVRSEQVFFIGGAPKSGTTWLQYLLNAHPEISCGGEGHFPNRLLPMLAKTLQTYNTGINVKNRSIYERR